MIYSLSHQKGWLCVPLPKFLQWLLRASRVAAIGCSSWTQATANCRWRAGWQTSSRLTARRSGSTRSPCCRLRALAGAPVARNTRRRLRADADFAAPRVRAQCSRHRQRRLCVCRDAVYNYGPRCWRVSTRLGGRRAPTTCHAKYQPFVQKLKFIIPAVGLTVIISRGTIQFDSLIPMRLLLNLSHISITVSKI